MSIGLCNIFRPFSPRSIRRYAMMNGIWLCAPSFDSKPNKNSPAGFDVGVTKLRIHPKPYADLVTSEQPSPLGWLARNGAAVSVCHPEQARNRAVTAVQYCISPRASN